MVSVASVGWCGGEGEVLCVGTGGDVLLNGECCECWTGGGVLVKVNE